ncbi:MAG: hypothetical protein AAF841_10755 [Pseudomonadota bacterium]
MKGLTALFLLGPLAGAAMAEPVTLECLFVTECFETEACAESDFSMTIDWEGRTGADMAQDPDNPARPALAATEAESFEMVADLREGVLAFRRATQAGDWWTLTIFEDVARLSIHMPASDLALYYKGSCSGAAL